MFGSNFVYIILFFQFQEKISAFAPKNEKIIKKIL